MKYTVNQLLHVYVVFVDDDICLLVKYFAVRKLFGDVQTQVIIGKLFYEWPFTLLF